LVGGRPHFLRAHFFALIALFSFSLVLRGQDQDKAPFARLNAFGVFAAYSNDSSHILLGVAENRKLLNLGVSYNRRLYVNRIVNWQYSGELMPIAFESDPVQTTTSTYTYNNPTLVLTETVTDPTLAACHDSSGSGSIPNGGPTYVYVATCGRRLTVGNALSPVGFQWDFLTRKKIQPFFVGHGGYMYTTTKIPVAGAGSFNFTFDLGLGIEFYRSHTRSLRAEYRFHHISNAYTAIMNPGIDSGLFQVAFTFGR
jgi:Lipid A 3-O-deacylase (PagL)